MDILCKVSQCVMNCSVMICSVSSAISLYSLNSRERKRDKEHRKLEEERAKRSESLELQRAKLRESMASELGKA